VAKAKAKLLGGQGQGHNVDKATIFGSELFLLKSSKLFGIKGLCNQKRWKPVRGGLTYAHGTHARYEKLLFLKNILKK